ncbi:uncharacterized protein [Vulpes vulpes]|uniref:Uncharacterized protein isoform X3 n=1 Tax=Vulpes vulpes TaxID=9627 RepID=A0ABM4ZW46_VULVU
MRPRKTFRVAGQLARTPSCGAVGRSPVGVLPPKVSVLRPGPLLGSSWGPWAFDARLPGTVVPKTLCVRAVMATVVSGQTTLLDIRAAASRLLTVWCTGPSSGGLREREQEQGDGLKEKEEQTLH